MFHRLTLSLDELHLDSECMFHRLTLSVDKLHLDSECMFQHLTLSLDELHYSVCVSVTFFLFLQNDNFNNDC